jgi:hypothetical protein
MTCPRCSSTLTDAGECQGVLLGLCDYVAPPRPVTMTLFWPPRTPNTRPALELEVSDPDALRAYLKDVCEFQFEMGRDSRDAWCTEVMGILDALQKMKPRVITVDTYLKIDELRKKLRGVEHDRKS